MLPSPFKHELLGEIFGKFLPFRGVRTNFQISPKCDFFFGYPTNTVEIQFGGQKFSPEYHSSGHGQARFVDYTSLIYAVLPKSLDHRVLDPEIFDQGIDSFDSLLAFGGCHRLGTGAMAYLATHPESLKSLLEPKGIMPFEESFEAIFRVEAITGVPLLVETSLSLVGQGKIKTTR